MSQLKVNSIVPAGGIPAGASGGGIIQCVQATKTDAFTTTSTSYTTPTGLSVSITPRSTSSKILILASIPFNITGDTGHCYARLYRGETSIFEGDAASNRNTATFSQNNSGGNADQRAAISYIDSPGTTSSTTYSIRVKSSNGATVYVNRSVRDNDGTQYDGRTVSSIVVLEVSG